jgi:hypothetical protein
MLTVIESPKFDIDEIKNSLQMLKEIISAKNDKYDENERQNKSSNL